ncbi:MAG: hypothetical protein ACTSRS_18585 [Candidatus Helarchaeota archaeon]
MRNITNWLENLQEILSELEKILSAGTPIDEIQYCVIVGNYSKELNLLLQRYFQSNDEIQDKMRPYLNYFRQLQHYLVYLTRYSTILQIPHHSEIQQTISFIQNQEELITKLYTKISDAQKALMTNNQFKEILEKALEEKLQQRERKK